MKKLFIALSLLYLTGCGNNSEKIKNNHEVLILDSISELYHKGDFDSCIRRCKNFTITYPNNDKGWHLLSGAYLAKNQDSLAEVCANKALKINPNNPIALTNQGIILDRQGKYKEAAVFYEKSLQVNDSLFQTYSNYAGNRGLVGEFSYAILLAEKAVTLGNRIGDKAILCYFYSEVGNFVKRDSLFKELKKMNYENLSKVEELIYNSK